MITSPSPAFRTAAADTTKPDYPPPFSIRFTWEERAELDRIAGREPWSRFIRKAVFGNAASKRRKAVRHPRVDDAALSKALGQLGASRLASNLNQIAKAAHQGTIPVTPELLDELHDACAEVNGKLAEAQRRAEHRKARSEFMRRKAELTERHRIERQSFDEQLEQQRILDTQVRQARFRTGFKGLWDRLRGEHRRITKLNEEEALAAQERDRIKRDERVAAQLQERRNLAVYAMQKRQRTIQERQLSETTQNQNWNRDLER